MSSTFVTCSHMAAAAAKAVKKVLSPTSSSSGAIPPLTLRYFDSIWGRGEPIRYLLRKYKVPFVDDRVAGPSWVGMKMDTARHRTFPALSYISISDPHSSTSNQNPFIHHPAFGTLPVLESGKGPKAYTLHGSNAILHYTSNFAKIRPKDPLADARVIETMNAVEDLSAATGVSRAEKDPEKKKAMREASVLPGGILILWLERMEALLKRNGHPGYVVEGSETAADLKLFFTLRYIERGQMDFISPRVFDGFPNLIALYKRLSPTIPTVMGYPE